MPCGICHDHITMSSSMGRSNEHSLLPQFSLSSVNELTYVNGQDSSIVPAMQKEIKTSESDFWKSSLRYPPFVKWDSLERFNDETPNLEYHFAYKSPQSSKILVFSLWSCLYCTNSQFYSLEIFHFVHVEDLYMKWGFVMKYKKFGHVI